MITLRDAKKRWPLFYVEEGSTGEVYQVSSTTTPLVVWVVGGYGDDQTIALIDVSHAKAKRAAELRQLFPKLSYDWRLDQVSNGHRTATIDFLNFDSRMLAEMESECY